ncbi:outer arm dynein light chain 1 [Mycena floridula]|nr:outer arm dynein light chain 1 [Mycena floridula]
MGPGSRISLSGHLGTIKFVGAVENTTGTWLGVEWDDPERGRHDGVKDGVRYFSCRIPNSGSFIRPTAVGISYGSEFLEALFGKYIENPHGSQSQETVLLGSSHGNIQVEAVRLDKIRTKFANLDRLREISLDNELVARSSEPGSIRRTLPNVRGLDLSSSLLPDWDTVARIAVELPLLQRLTLNRNRLASPRDLSIMSNGFLAIIEICLSATLTTWSELEEIAIYMPKLCLIEMGYNHLASLVSPGQKSSTVQSINLDGNECTDWTDIGASLLQYKSLDRLIMTSNLIEAIPPRPQHSDPLVGLKQLSLSLNRLHTWDDIDALHQWCPSLESFALTDNPLVDHDDLAKYSRQLIIAKIPCLKALDGTRISTRERNDCEIFYLSHIAQHVPETDRHLHPQWDTLCQKHGKPGSGAHVQSQTLGKRLIDIKLVRCMTRPSPSPIQPQTSDTFMIRALPSMTLRSLRLKISKTLRCDKTVSLWLKMADGGMAELGLERDKEDLAWLGFEQNIDLFYWIQS